MNEENNPRPIPNENQVKPGTVIGASQNMSANSQGIPANDSQGQLLDGPIVPDEVFTEMPETTGSTIYGGGNKFLSQHSKKRIIGVSLVALTLLAGAIGLVASQVLKNNQQPADPLTSISSEKLKGITEQKSEEASQLTVNSPLLVNSKLVVTPSAPPTTSQAGEIYFNADTKRFVYYDGASYQAIVNGQEFSQLSALSRATTGTGLNLVGGVLNNGGVLSLQGRTGDVSFSGGAGITLNGTQIANSGVLSIQGASGNVSFTAGNGIGLNGLMVTNTGVTALTGSADQVVVSSTNGAVTLSLPQSIGTSSTPTFGSLTLTAPLGVASGGTGATSGAFSNKGVVYFNGTNLVSTGVPGSNGLCLISTASGPAFGSCTGSAQVTSVNGLTGGLTIAEGSGISITDNGSNTITITALAASGVTSLQGGSGGTALNGVLTVNNATTAGSAITIDNASTTGKGIAKFNSADFTVNSGDVSLKNIAVNKGGTGKTSFSTNTVLLGNGASGITELAAGTDGQCLIMQSGAPVFATCTGAGGVSSVNSKSGTVTIQGGTAISVDDFGTNIVLHNTGVTSLQGTPDQVVLDVSTGSVTLSLPQNIALTSNVTFNQVTLGLNGSSAGKVVFGGSTANSVTLQAPASPTAGLTFTLPVTDGSSGECLRTNGSGALSFSSCVGGGSGGGISGTGNTNKLAKFTSGQGIGDSSITDDGSVVTVSVSAAIQGSGGLLIGTPSVAGVLNLSDGSSNTTQLKSASLNSDIVFTLPSTTGSSGECIKTNGSGVLSFGTCLTGGSGSGVNSLVGASGGVVATGDITFANTTSTGSTITIDNASTIVKGIASFNSTHFSVTGGAVSIKDDGIALGTKTTGNYVAEIVAGKGLTGDTSGEGLTATLVIGQGNGITVNADDIAVNVHANKGLKVDVNGVGLIDCATNEVLKYNGSGQWACAGDADTGDGVGVTTIGAIDSQTKNANGAVVSGTTLYLQTADASNVGLVSVSNQTFAGVKTFADQASFSNGLAIGSGKSIVGSGALMVQAALNNNLTLATSGTGNLIFSGLNCSASGNGGKLTVDASGVVMCADDTGGDGVGISSVTAEDDSIAIGGTGNAPTVAVNLNTNKGLEVTANGLGLLSSCANNQILKYNATTTNWTCADDIDTNTQDGQGVTSITEGDGITVNASNAAAPTVAIKLQPGMGLALNSSTGLGLLNTCTAGQVLKYNGSAWACADDIDTDTNTQDGQGVTSVTATDASIDVDDTDPAAPKLAVRLQANKGIVLDAVNGLGLMACANSQVLKYNTGTSSWGCADDVDTDTDTGITGSGTTGYLTQFDADGNLVNSIIDGSVANTITLQTSTTTALLNSSAGLTIASGGTGQLTLTSASGTIGTASDIQSTGSVTATGAIRSNTGFNVNGTAGTALACGANEVLQNATITGGIVTGGTCVEMTAGGDVYLANNNPFTGQSNSFTSNATTQNALLVAADSLTTGSGLKVTTASTNLTGGTLVDISQNSTYSSVFTASNQLLNVGRTVTGPPNTATITLDNSTAKDGTFGSPITFNHTVTSTTTNPANINRVLFVSVVHDQGTVTGVTATNGGNTQSLVKIGELNSGKHTLWALVAPGTGTNTITITRINDNGTIASAIASSWYGVDQVTPIASTVTATAGVAAGSISVTPSSSAGQMVVDFFGQHQVSGVSQSNGVQGVGQTFVRRSSSSSSDRVSSSYRLGAASMSWTWSGDAFAGLFASVLNPATIFGATDGTLSGSVANFSSSCSGCTETGNILSLQQSNTSATGAVLAVQNAGTGADIQLGSGIIRAQSNGYISFQKADGSNSLLTVDTYNNRVTIGDANDSSLDGFATMLVLDSATYAQRPTGVNGGIFYDTDAQAFRFYQNGSWVTYSTGGGGNVSQSGYTNGRLAQFDSSGNIVDSIISGSTADQVTLQAAGATATITANTALTVAAGGTNQNLTLQASGTGRVIVGSLLNVQGALKLDVTSSNASTYATPVGSNVPTAINIPYYDPGAYGQIVAMGLPSTAISTARVISLFDARTSAHQPTITVFSPNESQVFGLSWDGSNTDAYVKSSGTSIIIQPNSVNGLKVSSTGVTVQVTGTTNITNTSTTGFVIQSSSSNLFVADTNNMKVGVGAGPSAGGATLQVFGNFSSRDGINIYTGSTYYTVLTGNSGTPKLQNVIIDTTGSTVKASTATTSVLYTDSSGNIKQIATNNTSTSGTYCLITDGGNTVGFGDCPTSGSSYGEGRVSYDNTSTSDSLRWNPVSNAWGTYTIRIGSGGYTAASGDYLEYDLWCESGDCSPAVTNGDSQLGVDQNGIKNGITDMNNRTGADASAYANGRWYHRKISLTAGTSMSATYLRWAATGQSTGVFYFKNIHITNGSTIKKRIWDNGKPNGTLAIGGSGSRPCAGSCSSYGVEELRWDYQQAVDVSELSVFRNKLTVGCELYRNDSNSPYGTACTNNSSYTNGASQTSASYIVQKTATFGVYGTIAATGTITASTTPDIAETIDAAPDVEAGDVVVPDPNNPERAIKSTKAYDSSVMGAISDGSGGFLINSYGDKREATSEDGLTGKPLVLAGRIKVKVSGENGAIRIGDPITTSNTPGYGMKATKAGSIIGHALDNFSGDKGEVLVFLNLSYYSPETDENIQSAATDNLQAGTATFETLNIAETATINELHVTGSATIASLTVSGKAVFNSNIEVNGHIVTGGNTPTAAALGDATVALEGNDTAGTITVTTGANATNGDLAKVVFSNNFEKTPRIMLSGQDDASLAARVYPSAKSASSFTLKTEQTLAPNTTYTYDYFVIQ